MDYIPVVDLSKITGSNETVNDADFYSTAEDVCHALSSIGFLYLKNHGVKQEIIEKAFGASQEFFELPQDVKNRSIRDKGKRFVNGYHKKEINLLYTGSRYELRESYSFNGENRCYPEACPEFGPLLEELEEACKPLAKDLLRILAMSIKLEDKEYFLSQNKWLDDHTVETYTILRSLYYPAIPDNIPVGTVRCAGHTDHGTLTLLFQDQIGGLEVKSVSGKWMKAKPIPGTILVNTGDLLEKWSGGKFPATYHQVVIPEEEKKRKTHRQSIVLFLHPDAVVSVSPLIGDSCEDEPINAKEHAMRRLNVL